MYRQVRVNDEHIDYQRIVWRKSPSDPIKDYRLLTVTYGVASASHLAVKALQQTAIDNKCNHPTAAQIALRDFYMDDLLTGSFQEADLHHLQLPVSALLSKGGFHLRKWSTNSTLVLNAIPVEQREIKQSLELSNSESVKALGLEWHPSSDKLIFRIQVHEIDITKLTKRLLLSDAARLFDPLGLLSPCTIIPKILFQRLWRPKLDWDEPVPPAVKQQWLHYRQNLTSLAAIKLPRWIGTGDPNAITDLHGFADASQTAYAAVVYARTKYPDGHISVHVLTAKTRVAPLKTTTLPRLELCAAGLLAQLVAYIKASLEPLVCNTYGWTDSTVTLAWIRQHPSKWCTFVANRVSQIQRVNPPENWFYIKSEQNPADCASRGLLPQYLIGHPLWWNGPLWLSQLESAWPPQQQFTTTLDQKPDSVNITNVSQMAPVWELIERYGSLSKLKHVTAYVLRFLYNTRIAVSARRAGEQAKYRTGRQLHLQELDEALTFWINLTQRHCFANDIERLKANKPLSRQSKIIRLHPFLDTKGLLRVGGRLSNSSLQLDRKHPLILPSSARLTLLICEEIHLMTLHAGPQIMQVMLQSRFWLINARKILRKISRSCVKCRRHSHTRHQQLMGDLPKPRVEACRPFLRSGVDFAGTRLQGSERVHLHLHMYGNRGNALRACQ